MKLFGKALILAAALPLCGAGAEKIVFKETFDSPEALEKWRRTEFGSEPSITVENGALSVNHKHNPGYGSYIEIQVPKIKRGKIDFDVLIDPERTRPYACIGLTFELYNIATFWHDSCRDWRMYFPEPNSQRMPEFNIEPVGHHQIGYVQKHKFVHYSIFFDEEKDLVEFYADDMRDPKAARYDVSVFGHGFYRGGFLRIGSFGFASSPYRTLVDNVVLTEMPEQTGNVRKTEYLLFDGLASDILKFNGELKKFKVHRFPWDSPGANIVSYENNYRYTGMPGFNSVEQARLIVFNDAPNVPAPLQRQMIKSVESGTDILIHGGLFSFNKGGFKNSPLERILPVRLKNSLWDFSGSENKPMKLKSAAPFRWNTEGKQLYYFWDLEPADGAEILMTASEPGLFGRKNIPVLLRKKTGKGYVYVMTGTPCGPDTEKSFWNTDFIPELLKFIESEKIKEGEGK